MVVLGDSITQAGQYVEFLETIVLAETGRRYEWINVGLASETVSGLSEPGHAEGKFPRPDLHERLGRVLEKTRPDAVMACYGMNCGIYFPFRDKRFNAFATGMEKLHAQVEKAGTKIIHVTPPVFDPVPIKEKVLPAGLNAYPQPFEGYNRVLDRYSGWLMGQKSKGWEVIDLHEAMNRALAEQRGSAPEFSFSKDGIHPGKEGHWVMSEAILAGLGVKHPWKMEDLTEPGGALAEVYKLVGERQRVRKGAWLAACGHQRPTTGKTMSVEEAEARAAMLGTQLEEVLKRRQTAGTAKGNANEPAVKAAPTPPEPAKKPEEAGLGPYPGKVSDWFGFERHDFDWEGRTATVVTPKQPAESKPWVWHGEFFGHKPDPDIALLEKGFHVVYLKLTDTLGCPETVKAWTRFYGYLRKERGLGAKPALVGLSRGGLYCYNWATANPDKVACIYADAPVCDFKSWPGGKGKGPGDARNWARVLPLWGFKDEAEALAYQGNPVDSLAPLVKHKVPLLHVFGDADEVVPAEENTLLLAERYRKLGGTIELIAKAGGKHHPHGLQDSAPIVNFIVKHAK